MMQHLPIRRALLSMSDKTGLLELGRALAAHGAELLSTGGTARDLRAAGLPVVEVSEHTGFPEILDGRVKTLQPAIHGGILGRRDLPQHLAQLQAHGIAPIDLVAVSLYPFEATVAAGAAEAECVENIDIGGPALLRAAAKNFDHVAVLSDPAQYAELIEELALGGTSHALRRRLSAAAYARTAAYDAAVASWFARDTLPERLVLAGRRMKTLRYGENPQQQAAFYADGSGGLALARQMQGKELSYNNLADADAAMGCVAEFDRPSVVIVKHANPCGAAVADTLALAWDAALAGDPVSAFGGIVAVNRTLDEATAERITAIFTEVILAPDADPAALAVLGHKRNLRLLLGPLPDPRARGVLVRSVAGGLLSQTRDTGRATAADLRVVTRRAPTAAETADLLFAAIVGKHVKSNAIVLVHEGATLGIGAGQMSRLDSARLAVAKAGVRGCGAVAGSDAFFPFADGVEALAAAGVTAIVQPGGSMRDAEVVAAADAADIAMVFTGLRHFRH